MTERKPSAKIVSAATLERGAIARIVAVSNPSAHARLMEFGLIGGTQIRIARRAPMGDPLELEVNGARLALRAEEADSLQVEVLP